MSGNNLLTTDLISNTALAEFTNSCPFVTTGSRVYQPEFTNTGYKINDTIRIRRQNQFLVGDGPTATVQNIIESNETLQIAHQYHTMIAYDIKDLTLAIGDFNRMFIQPAIQAIISQMESDIATSAELQSYNFSGSALAPINSYGTVENAGANLLNLSVNLAKDAYFAMSVKDGSALKSGFLTNFTPMVNENIAKNSAITHMSYFDLFQSQNIKFHTAGVGASSGDALTVTNPVSSGNSIALSGAATTSVTYFVPGDVISIAGVTKVNPLTYNSTGQNMQFVVTNTAASSGGLVTINVSPSIIISGPLQNVSNTVPGGSVVTKFGSHYVNMAYPSRGLDIVCPPLARLATTVWSQAFDKTTGLSLTLTQSADITTYTNLMRLDILTGHLWHPQYINRVMSSQA